MSFEGITKDIKDERQPMGKKRYGGLKWVGENIVLVLVRLHQNWYFTYYSRILILKEFSFVYV